MLDLNDPMTECVFKASGLIDQVRECARKFSVSPEWIYPQILSKCFSLLEEMRELALDHFAEQVEFIWEAVDDLEKGLRMLAFLASQQVTEDRRPFLRKQRDELLMPAVLKLESFAGFGTWAI